MFISGVIPNSQKVEASQVSMWRRLDGQNVVNLYNGVSFSLEEEGNSDTSYNRAEPGAQAAK